MVKYSDDSDDSGTPANYCPDITSSFAYLYGPVNTDTITPIIKFIITCNVMNPKLPNINLFINSDGGELHQAFALIATIKSSIIPVNTIVIGEAQSAGLMIAMAGKKRYISSRAQIMSHLYSDSHPEARASDLKYKNRDITLTIRRMIDHYEECTGLPRAKIRRTLLPNHDVYLTADQCIQYNMFDELYTSLTQFYQPVTKGNKNEAK